jgi:predicted ArsR family transcriptional regulator
MDFFDERILTALKDAKPKDFTVLLDEVGFSHNTLQQHLERLTTKGLVVRDKSASNNFGRPKFAYRVLSRTTKQVNAALEDSQVELVAIAFSRLRHVCRFRKGGYCKEARRDCAPQICPKIRKQE